MKENYKNPILKKYLDINFKQNLTNFNKEKDKLYYDYFKKKDRPFREFLRKYHLDLNFLRKKIQNINLKKMLNRRFKIDKFDTSNSFKNCI